VPGKDIFRSTTGFGQDTATEFVGRLPKLHARLIGVLATDGPPLSGGGIEASEKRPSVVRPSRVEQRMVPGALLMGQFRIAKLSGKELARCRTLRLGPFPAPPHQNCS
jgi:hypothetical protein